MWFNKRQDYLFGGELQTELTFCAVCCCPSYDKIAEGQDYLHATTHQEYSFVKCQKCEHIYLNPRPKIDEIAKIYPSSYSTYNPGNIDRKSVFAMVKDTVLKNRLKLVLSHIPDSAVILDIGCGDLSLLKDLRKYTNEAHLIGLDWNFGPGLEKSAHEFGIKTITGTIETAELPKNYCDLIIMNQLIEHVWDVEHVLSKCNTILKPGGVLSIETPNADGWDRKFFQRRSWGGYYWPRHLNIFSSSGLKTVLKDAGFEILSHHKLLAPPIWIYSLQFFLSAKGYRNLSQRLFSDKSILWLTIFTLVDLIAKICGSTTSNQKIIVRKTKK